MAHHHHQFPLDSMQQLLPSIFCRQHGAHDTNHGIQFIKASVCLDTDVIFRHTRATMNTRCSFVSSFGIDSFHSLFDKELCPLRDFLYILFEEGPVYSAEQ